MAGTEEVKSILSVPVLEPERRYDSEGIIPKTEPVEDEAPEEQEEPLLEVLDGLERVYRLADLLPPGLATIIRNITHELSVDTQGKIIQNIQRKKEEEKEKSPEPVEDSPEDPSRPRTPGTSEEGGGYEVSPFQKRETTINPTYIKGPTYEEESSEPSYQTYAPIGEAASPLIVNVEDDEEYVADIFSRDPDFTVVPSKMNSLVDLSRAAYLQDDADIKKHYTSKMLDLSQRFFQVMNTIAVEAGMSDHSYLMQDFDGTAVTTSDPNQQHLIDSICKNQVIYDQKERFMNKTHTARNTLIHMRSMTSSEKQRERYLAENYAENQPTYATSFSNDLLEKARAKSDENYKESAYGFYKYLNSATELTNTMLNMKIDEGIAKAQLAATGSDIYAYTPPPAATPSKVDDGGKTVKTMEQKIQGNIDSQGRGGVTGGSSGSGSSGGSFSGTYETVNIAEANNPVVTGNISGSNPKAELANKIGNATGIPPALVWVQMYHETGNFESELAVSYHNYGGVKGAKNEIGSDSRGHSYFASDEDYATYMINYYPLYAEDGLLQARTIGEWAAALKHGGYYTDSLENYTHGLLGAYGQLIK